MDNLLAHKLTQLRQSPHFDTLKKYLSSEIENARDQLENSRDPQVITALQGGICAFRGILKDFEQLELFVQNRDNSNASPGE